MQTAKFCPTCNARHLVELPHEWEKLNGRHELTFALKSQSTSIDGPKLDNLFPMEPDGQELVAETQWADNSTVHLKLFRRPISTKGKDVKAPPNVKQSRADMETEAAERGLTLNPKWNDLQLAHALSEHKSK